MRALIETWSRSWYAGSRSAEAALFRTVGNKSPIHRGHRRALERWRKRGRVNLPTHNGFPQEATHLG